MKPLSERLKDFPTSQFVDWLCLACVDVREVRTPDDAQEEINKIREAVAERLVALEQRAEAAEKERDRRIADYKRLIDQHMPRTIDGCDEGWSRVIEAHELQTKLEAAEAKLAELEKQELSAKVKLYRQENIIPEGLNRSTAELVLDFAKALAEKLHRSEQKYGWSDGWKESDWQEKCIADFHHHIGKGDPLDVAAYCAFMVYHDWSTRPAPAINLAELVPDGKWINPAPGFESEDSYSEGWNACRVAILRNIEEAKTK